MACERVTADEATYGIRIVDMALWEIMTAVAVGMFFVGLVFVSCYDRFLEAKEDEKADV